VTAHINHSYVLNKPTQNNKNMDLTAPLNTKLKMQRKQESVQELKAH
jgi:hypothetical protein